MYQFLDVNKAVIWKVYSLLLVSVYKVPCKFYKLQFHWPQLKVLGSLVNFCWIWAVVYAKCWTKCQMLDCPYIYPSLKLSAGKVIKHFLKGYLPTSLVRPNKNICVFQVSRPYLGFCPDPKHFIVNCEQNVVKFAGKCIEKCSFYIKYFDKIKCYANWPYLVFFQSWNLKHTYIFFLPNRQ